MQMGQPCVLRSNIMEAILQTIFSFSTNDIEYSMEGQANRWENIITLAANYRTKSKFFL